ncbi:hypothetical protein BAUCODRAFT_27922 [Baudoinia panamericana UAMH 10762]|uniref:IBR domain-containing protein n=1 Tax=Baudoinia panamericana (strain UAMH 10762) TaxID=717646 RepID=M2LCH2_BAUPA|nr:uncharacterized protein BAUCODRAFT_27922 [Baudoinia panamericana UAMH 10762]EMC91647.1 hypothetical protein BAUCODRAFT_27922 [Baudoinia panamericana UAMH 10762]
MPPVKRKLSAVMETSKDEHPEVPRAPQRSTASWIVCGDAVPLETCPYECATQHTSTGRACGECWELHISTQVKEKPGRAISCMLCPSLMSDKSLKRLARVTTRAMYTIQFGYPSLAQRENYRKSMLMNGHFQCQDRCKGVDTTFQPYHREQDGRVFACKDCGLHTCVDCDHPEHSGETCIGY